MNFPSNYISIGNGVPLLFQHGLTADSSQIGKLLGEIQGLQLMSVDCPGHGKSKLSGTYRVSFDTYAEEMIRFLDFMNINKAIVGGLSMGAGIAMNMSNRFIDRVLGLILLRPAWIDQRNPHNLQILLEAAELFQQEDGMERFKRSKEWQKINKALPAAAASILGVFADHQQAELPKVIRSMVGDSPLKNLESLSQIQKPCLIIGNEDDPLHPFEMSTKIHEKIKHSSLKKVISRYIDEHLHNEQVKNHIIEFYKNSVAIS